MQQEASTATSEAAPSEQEVQAALEKTVYKFLGVLAGAIALGTALGICCIMFMYKCCALNQA